MSRMQSLRLMPSHTYFYKKLSEYGKDHDLAIKSMVSMEGKRKTAVIQSVKQSTEKEDESTRQHTCTDTTEVRTCYYPCFIVIVMNNHIYSFFRIVKIKTNTPLTMKLERKL